MTSKKQIAANRRNARKSTGPKSDEGKNVVRFNALRHGLTAEHLVLPGESEEEFDALMGRFYDELAPQGQLERFLVDQMVVCAWRLLRISKVETGIYAHMQHQMSQEAASTERLADVIARSSSADVPKSPNTEPGSHPERLGDAFLRATIEADAFSKISRYETSIRAGFYQAYDEFMRHKKRRARAQKVQARKLRLRQP